MVCKEPLGTRDQVSVVPFFVRAFRAETCVFPEVIGRNTSPDVLITFSITSPPVVRSVGGIARHRATTFGPLRQSGSIPAATEGLN
jgi:hypothetical protein